jgi:hypothetical protein
MSINNFRSVRINGAGTLVVQGKTLERFGGEDGHLPVGATAEVVVISADDDAKRCHTTVVDLGSSDWRAEAAPADHEFASLDAVCAVGALNVPGEPSFLWGKTFVIDAPDPLK